MKTNIFISYAWTSDSHRKWVRLLATQLRLLGYTVQIDSHVPYGASLSGFMREVTEADRVLMIIDENYVERANQHPESGVAIENNWIKNVFEKKPISWLSVLFVDNPNFSLPSWLINLNPKGFNFNSNPDINSFPGFEQMDDLWRWIEGLPADKAHALTAEVLLERMARIERIDAMRDPANYASPALKDRITFPYKSHPYYKLGHGEYEFKVNFSDRGSTGVYVYTDSGLKALGLVPTSIIDPRTVDTFLRSGRFAEPDVGQSVVMMNTIGALCIMKIEAVQLEVNDPVHVPSAVTFSYEILTDR
ncbi:toll/interleukin-1 receptor domain-containing protein [Achromobacter xylosoxidans]